MFRSTIKLIFLSSTLFPVSCGFDAEKAMEDFQMEGEGRQLSPSDEQSTDELLSEYYLALGLNEEESEQAEVSESEERLVPEDNFADSKSGAILQTVKGHLKTYKEKKQAICAKDSELRQSIKEQLDAIKADESLDFEAKKDAIKAIFEEHNDAIEEEKASFKECVEENYDSLELIREAEKELKVACLVRPKVAGEKPERTGDRSEFGRGMPGGQNGEEGENVQGTRSKKQFAHGQRKGKKHKIVWTEEMIAELEAQLNSDECTEKLEELASE